MNVWVRGPPPWPSPGSHPRRRIPPSPPASRTRAMARDLPSVSDSARGTYVRASPGSVRVSQIVGPVLEARTVLQKHELHLSDGPVTLLGNHQFRDRKSVV